MPLAYPGLRDTDWTSQHLLRGESVFLTGVLGLPEILMALKVKGQRSLLGFTVTHIQTNLLTNYTTTVRAVSDVTRCNSASSPPRVVTIILIDNIHFV